jgi:hypothetical protein
VKRNYPVEVLWCASRRRRRHDGWAFPKEIETKIIELAGGNSVLQLFGGKAKFGVRMDIDPRVRPDVIGDAWMPPFAENSFDTVVLDPPYFQLNSQVRISLFMTAARIAARQVIWLHTLWVSPACGLQADRAWLVRVGDSCTVRCLQVFKRTDRRILPMRHISRGPGMKYNRWLIQPQGLPFPKREEATA